MYDSTAHHASFAHKFTGKERDSETGNDDFGVRYYSSSFGRFLSADWSAIPEPVPYANLTNPQTLNLYVMVSDNPETFADLDGHGAAPDTTDLGRTGRAGMARIRSARIAGLHCVVVAKIYQRRLPPRKH